MGVNTNAARFPAEVERFFRRSASHPWEGFGAEGQSLLRSLGVKLEPFVVPTPPGFRLHSVVGFELLAFGPNGESHFVLCDQARKAKVGVGVLGVALMLVGTLTARKLMDAWFEHGFGHDANRTVFTLNVDKAMLACRALKELLNQAQKPGYRLWLEVSEDLKLDDVAEIKALRALINEYDWLRLALDDSNLHSTDVGVLIHSRVELVKVDGKHVQQLLRDDWTTTRGRVAEELAKLGKAGVPLVTEGIENWDMKIALCNSWSTGKYGELWLQGWHICVSEDWARLLIPIDPDDPAQPKGYLFSGNGRGETKPADRAGRVDQGLQRGPGNPIHSTKEPPEPGVAERSQRGPANRATLKGSGAIAQGDGSTAVGAGGVFVGGGNSGNINTGKQTIATAGGAVVFGGVRVRNGDFIGRDRRSVSSGGVGTERLHEPPAYTSVPGARGDDSIRQAWTEGDMHAYAGSDASVLKAALVRLGHLKAADPLPPPYREKSGMAGKSRLYFLFVPSGSSGINLVAKFDAPERARREWDQLEKLHSVDMALHAMLPIHGNCREDGVIIYRAAHGATLSGHCTDLAEYLGRQLESAPPNCVRALDLSLDVLALFYQRGGLAMAQAGRVIFWRTLFDTLSEKKDRLATTAEDAWPQIDWSAERIALPADIVGRRSFPNPLAQFESLLKGTTGQVMLSRVHGDLNLTNLLIGEDSEHAPASTFIIDLAYCEEGKVTATDLARLETEFWHEAFSGMRDAATGQRYGEAALLRALVELRDCLEGRPIANGPVLTQLERGGLHFVHRLRQRAAVSLRGNFGDYLLEDFFHCLYFSGLNALAFPTVYENPTKARIALLGAALSLQTLNDLKAGRYGPGAADRLASPLRPLSDMLGDLTRGAGGSGAPLH